MKSGIVFAGLLLGFGAGAAYEPEWKEYIEVNEFTGELKRAGASVINTNTKSGVIAMKLICLDGESGKERFLLPIVYYKGNDPVGKKIKVEYRVDGGAIAEHQGLVDDKGIAGIVHVFSGDEIKDLKTGTTLALRVTGREEFVGSFTLKGFARSFEKLSEVCK